MENLAIGATFVYMLVFILFWVLITWLDYWEPDYHRHRRGFYKRNSFRQMFRNLMYHLREGPNKKAA